MSTLPPLHPFASSEAAPPLALPPAPAPSLVNDPALFQDISTVDLLKAEAARREAFSSRFSFKGSPLYPFSSSRKALFLDIRGAVGAPPLGSMDSLFADARRVLFLCSFSGKQIEEMQAGIGLPFTSRIPLTLRFQAAVNRWADANASALDACAEGEHPGAAVVELFLDIWQASEQGQAMAPSPLESAPSGN